MATPMVYLENLTKTRSQSESVFELQVSSFAVYPGQLIAVIGESGCGKSTLLDLVALVMAPTRVAKFQVSSSTGTPHDVAKLWEQGDESKLARLRRDHFGYVLQTGGLLPFLTVRHNIGLPGRVKGMGTDEKRLHSLAKRLGVVHCLDRMPISLSIGQRQRVAILRALAHQPQLVLADEPTASVDKARARSIMEDMHTLAREEGVAVVVVTHDVDLIYERADAICSFETTQVSEQVSLSVCQQEQVK
ncbi:MAG: ATP-binding cassette domain-containing protein [Desulfomicrobium sp.]|nr:ATP-binding cassette domain-containing protein [Desulfomicrobium sp.]